jgi:hypothetical protein
MMTVFLLQRQLHTNALRLFALGMDVQNHKIEEAKQYADA